MDWTHSNSSPLKSNSMPEKVNAWPKNNSCTLGQITLYNLPPILLPPPLSHFHKITNSLAGFGGRWSPFSSPLRIVSQFVCASLGQVRSASGPPPPPPPLSSPHSHNPTQRCRLSQFRQRSREKLGKSRQQQHSLGPPPPRSIQCPQYGSLFTRQVAPKWNSAHNSIILLLLYETA